MGDTGEVSWNQGIRESPVAQSFFHIECGTARIRCEITFSLATFAGAAALSLRRSVGYSTLYFQSFTTVRYWATLPRRAGYTLGFCHAFLVINRQIIKLVYRYVCVLLCRPFQTSAPQPGTTVNSCQLFLALMPAAAAAAAAAAWRRRSLALLLLLRRWCMALCHSLLLVMGGMVLCTECVTDEANVTVMNKHNVSGSGILFYALSYTSFCQQYFAKIVRILTI